ncbi:uncharacterized protein LOC132800037 [Ziziphus jujuba]|uniref:Uncharacterized protein LOC132800037 n=1 Tax=Ziziphus jujuba TaxID=326968 RepID=A0ABM3ZWR6_ZIZJJ|nr:uncharacterized protein LOC132800037 [Ziziphus jujuba]
MAMDVWKQFDYLCQNYVLNGLYDDLYGVNCGTKTAKGLWKTLDRKYKTKNVGSRKFDVGPFLDYVMVDFKPLIWMVINEAFQVAIMIEKLPPSWKDFKNYIKYKRKKMDMEALVGKLRFEHDNRRFDKRSLRVKMKANIVEHDQSSKNKKKIGKDSRLEPKGGISKKAKFQGKCCNCDKMGHRVAKCKLPERKKNKEA